MLRSTTQLRQFEHWRIPESRQVIRVDTESGRYYSYNGETSKYPSVTTVLSVLGDAGWLEEWKSRVGEERANRVSKIATTRGSSLHDLCEKYVKNLDIKDALKKSLIIDSNRFQNLVPELNKIQMVYASEILMISEECGYAGTADLVADFGLGVEIADFKTSKKPKTKEEIPTYFLQLAAYAIMFEEMFTIQIDYGRIIMSVENVKEPLILRENLTKWKSRFKRVLSLYEETTRKEPPTII